MSQPFYQSWHSTENITRSTSFLASAKRFVRISADCVRNSYLWQLGMHWIALLWTFHINTVYGNSALARPPECLQLGICATVFRNLKVTDAYLLFFFKEKALVKLFGNDEVYHPQWSVHVVLSVHIIWALEQFMFRMICINMLVLSVFSCKFHTVQWDPYTQNDGRTSSAVLSSLGDLHMILRSSTISNDANCQKPFWSWPTLHALLNNVPCKVLASAPSFLKWCKGRGFTFPLPVPASDRCLHLNSAQQDSAYNFKWFGQQCDSSPVSAALYIALFLDVCVDSQ